MRGNLAFMNIGTDLAGPLFTRYTLKDTSFFKVWIVIFTYSLSGAVHLELVENSTIVQLRAFRRFISRRGTSPPPPPPPPSSLLVIMHQTGLLDFAKYGFCEIAKYGFCRIKKNWILRNKKIWILRNQHF